MRSGRQDLQLSFIVIAICLFLVSINHVYAKQEVEMAVRPFAIDPVNWHLLVDGIFDVSFNEHIIGVFLENKGNKAISNATAAASFPSGSGIKIIKGTYEFEDLERNKPALGFFRASFGNSKPGKYPLTLNISGEVSGKPDSWETSRDLFVIRSEVDPNVPNKWKVHVPEGKLIACIYKFNEGSNPGSSMALKKFEWFIEYVKPYKNPNSDFAFNDPWWKVIGSIVPVGAGQTDVDMRMTKLCGADCGDTVRSIGRAAVTASALAVTSDEADPFRIGQGKKPPGFDEVTTKEKVHVSMDYLSEPVVGTGFTAVAEWKYTRTTNVKTYEYTHHERVHNTHFIKKPGIKIKHRKSGDKKVFIITARTHSPMVRNNEAYFVANLFKADDTQLKKVVQSIVLRDDGHQGDRKAADGTYTGVVSSHDLPIDTPINVFVFGFDINNAAASDSPLVAAKEIGGVLISTPSFKAYALEPDSTIEVKEEIPSPSRFSLWGELKPPLWSLCFSDYFDKLKEDPGIIVTSSADTDRFFGGVDLSGEYKFGNSHKLGLSVGYQILPKGRFLQFQPLAKGGGRIKMDLSAIVIPLKLYYKLPVGESFFLKFAGGLDFYRSTIDYTRSILEVVIDTLKLEDSGIGGHVSLGIESFFNKNLAVTFVGEYTFGSLKNFSIPLFNMQGEIEEMPVEVDFGGVRLSAGIKFCFNKVKKIGKNKKRKEVIK